MDFKTNNNTRQTYRLQRCPELVPVTPASQRNTTRTVTNNQPNNQTNRLARLQRELQNRSRLSAPYTNRVTRPVRSTQHQSSPPKSPYLPCSICFDDMHPKYQKDLSSLPCGHVFCTSCITNWLNHRGVCAICRKDTRPIFVKPIYL